MRRTLAYLFLTALSLLGAALVSAKSAQLIERGGESFRKVTGPARFLHNNTYLLCDSALWNVTTNIIDAVGHVQIIQDRTRLSSGSLQYVVDDDLAKFRGGLVQLEDKDKNTLRTRYLDYNTKDSVAIFQTTPRTPSPFSRTARPCGTRTGRLSRACTDRTTRRPACSSSTTR